MLRATRFEITPSIKRHVTDTMTPLGEQVLDAVTAFLKLFCKSARMHERRSLKTGKSTAYYQVSVRVRLHALMPAHRGALQIYGYAEFYVRM